MTPFAKRAMFFILLALICLPISCARKSDTLKSVALPAYDESISAKDLRTEPRGASPSDAITANGAGSPAASAGPSKPGNMQPATKSPKELLQELAWSLSNGESGSQQRADELVEEIYQGGYESMFAIRDYLIRDIGFGTRKILDPGEQELRQKLIGLLLRFDFPEVEHIALELIGSHPTPQEIWQLGRYLESNYPGEYTDSVRLIAEDAFMHADPTTAIPGGFFQLLGETGNDETAFLLADVPIHQDAYASFALAAIPDGSGIPALEREAFLNGNGQPSTRSRLIIELLASQACRNAEAGEVLLEMAERGLIPADTWPHVMAIVSGSMLLTLEPPPQGQLETHTIFRPDGNQVIYRVVRPLVDEPPDIADQRHQLLDSLQALAPGYRGVSR